MDTAALVERIEGSFSSIYRCWLYYARDEMQSDLLSELATKLPHIDPIELPARLTWGGVFVNGIEQNINCVLPVPCKLEYYEPRFAISAADTFFPSFRKEFVLFEDDFLIAIFKPAKLPSLPGKEQKYFNVRSYIETHTGRKIHMPSRLDMSTSGVILMSKSEETHRSLQRIYERGTVKKTYLAGVSLNVPWENYDHQGAIGKDQRHAVLRRVVDNGGKESRTLFTKLGCAFADDSERCVALLKTEPLTGRTHQIRVHTSNLGAPIVGDNFYNGRPAAELHLMAYSLSFRHPKGGEQIRITVPSDLYPTWLKTIIAEIGSLPNL